MANKDTALQAQSTGYMALANNDIGAMMAEELNGLDVNFERIKIPSGGSTVFEMPGEDGEVETVKDFSAVILYHQTLFAYYKNKYTGGSNPPDCASFDGITGEGAPGGECEACQFNQFGSGENGAKACKSRRRVYILREGEIFPLLLSLPTCSLKGFTSYMMRVLSKRRNTNSVVTHFSLKKATSNSGVVYSQAHFTVDRPLTPEEYALVDKLSEQVKAFSKGVAYGYDAAASENDGVYVDPDTGEIIEPLDGAGLTGGSADV